MSKHCKFCGWCADDQHDCLREPWQAVRSVQVQSCADGSMQMQIVYTDEPIESKCSALGVMGRMAVAGWIEDTIRNELERLRT